MEYTKQEMEMISEMMRLYEKLKDTKEFNNLTESGSIDIKEVIDPINTKNHKHQNARWCLCI
ncbi:hypothetical protein V7166_23370 [Bacillus thuringiensis]